MKTLFRKILVLALVLVTYTSQANATSEITPTTNIVKKGNLISVTDDSGEVIYRGEIYYTGNLTSLFDFTQLKNGKYTVEITKAFEIKINTIEVKDHAVSLIIANQKTVFKPLVRNENYKILISKLALDSAEIKIELYFEGELIHAETVNGEKIINRVYKLDKTLKGSYTALIKSDDRVFIENFRI